MLFLSNLKHTLIEKVEQVGSDGKVYYVTKFNNNENFYTTFNVNQELFSRLEQGKQYTLCVDYKKTYNKDTNLFKSNARLVEVY